MKYLSSLETKERGIDLAHPFFDYIPPDDVEEIKQEINDGLSHLLCLEENKAIIAAFIITHYDDRIHIREIGGDYVRATKHVNSFAEQVAKALGIGVVSFTAKNPIIQKRSEIYGYKPSNQYKNEFERTVN